MTVKKDERQVVGLLQAAKLKGELLVALERYGNEQNFPIAWTCVRSETKLN